jgi:long-chain fatty acid transport protein
VTGVVRRACGAAAIVAALAVVPVSVAPAGGFYIESVGTAASLGTAGAGNVTNAFSPDAAWSNPAGLVWIRPGHVMTASVQVLQPIVEFDPEAAEAGGNDGGDAGDTAVIPSFFYAQHLTEDWSFGFGVSALQGGGVDYGNDFVGRYGTVDIKLTGIGATWSFGYKVNDRLSLGFGGTVVQTNFEQTIAVNQGQFDDGIAKLRDLDDLGVQPILGLQYRVSDSVFLGMTYRGEFDAELEGNVRFRNFVLPLPDQRNLDVDWTNPQWLEAGLRLGNDKSSGYWVLSGNWQQWSEFSDNRLAIDTRLGTAVQELDRNWDDTYRVALGYATRGYAENFTGWAVGLSYESSVVDDDDRTVDLPLDSSWSLSGAYGRFNPATNRGWSLATTLQLFNDAKIDQTSQGVRFAGEFDDYYVVFVGATYRF